MVKKFAFYLFRYKNQQFKKDKEVNKGQSPWTAEFNVIK